MYHLEKLNFKKVKTDFDYVNLAYCFRIAYNSNGSTFDLYLVSSKRGNCDKELVLYNHLTENINQYLQQVNAYVPSTYSGSEKKKQKELTQKELTLEIVEVTSRKKGYDTVLVVSKKYKLFHFFKKEIALRVEIKNGRIVSMERKKDTTKKNKRKAFFQKVK